MALNTKSRDFKGTLSVKVNDEVKIMLVFKHKEQKRFNDKKNHVDFKIIL